MKKIITLLFISVILLQSCYEESYVAVEAKFATEFKGGDESIPVYIELENLSKGADTYTWEFEGGSPATSDKKEPGAVLYSAPGSYTIKLTVSNVDGEIDSYEQKIEIKDAINIVFTKEILQSDYPPVEVKFTNNTQGQGLTYLWNFEGGSPSTSDVKDPPNVLFANPGKHAVKLSVSNGFETFHK